VLKQVPRRVGGVHPGVEHRYPYASTIDAGFPGGRGADLRHALVEVDGKATGELMDPLSQRRQRFIGLECLFDALQAWVDDAHSAAGGVAGSVSWDLHEHTPVCSRSYKIGV
jgi:hypothetical protein